ncbi:hypothetical protein A3C86_01355 [Candidatus Kaiserbacteria bacterium RIFCSPHIGHO2_02_FULL_49_16]|uniref:SHOCT domain-containing protein n=2 Tax=Parcubacteria group TaxID=1794811 RepID=A0A0G1WEQ2_9BACT|nr:MAG: hypothetical protein UY58_C0007G0010 [Candidatus Magasanikbacteria bacterium GW2011_GWA2_50_22]OGG59014.1 MAG: hypothetical protein A3C86_01355 [Candidatus Kaiserbacteria bacterium RIFCSPHIGHO2_02_FULL_49_16]
MMYYWGNYGGDFWPFHFIGFIGMLAFWALVIAGIVWLVRQPPANGGSTGHHSALDVLRTRYAKGELTKEQFESMKKDINA